MEFVYAFHLEKYYIDFFDNDFTATFQIIKKSRLTVILESKEFLTNLNLIDFLPI